MQRKQQFVSQRFLLGTMATLFLLAACRAETKQVVDKKQIPNVLVTLGQCTNYFADAAKLLFMVDQPIAQGLIENLDPVVDFSPQTAVGDDIWRLSRAFGLYFSRNPKSIDFSSDFVEGTEMSLKFKQLMDHYHNPYPGSLSYISIFDKDKPEDEEELKRMRCLCCLVHSQGVDTLKYDFPMYFGVPMIRAYNRLLMMLVVSYHRDMMKSYFEPEAEEQKTASGERSEENLEEAPQRYKGVTIADVQYIPAVFSDTQKKTYYSGPGLSALDLGGLQRQIQNLEDEMSVIQERAQAAMPSRKKGKNSKYNPESIKQDEARLSNLINQKKLISDRIMEGRKNKVSAFELKYEEKFFNKNSVAENYQDINELTKELLQSFQDEESSSTTGSGDQQSKEGSSASKVFKAPETSAAGRRQAYNPEASKAAEQLKKAAANQKKESSPSDTSLSDALTTNSDIISKSDPASSSVTPSRNVQRGSGGTKPVFSGGGKIVRKDRKMVGESPKDASKTDKDSINPDTLFRQRFYYKDDNTVRTPMIATTSTESSKNLRIKLLPDSKQPDAETIANTPVQKLNHQYMRMFSVIEKIDIPEANRDRQSDLDIFAKENSLNAGYFETCFLIWQMCRYQILKTTKQNNSKIKAFRGKSFEDPKNYYKCETSGSSRYEPEDPRTEIKKQKDEKASETANKFNEVLSEYNDSVAFAETSYKSTVGIPGLENLESVTIMQKTVDLKQAKVTSAEDELENANNDLEAAETKFEKSNKKLKNLSMASPPINSGDLVKTWKKNVIARKQGLAFAKTRLDEANEKVVEMQKKLEDAQRDYEQSVEYLGPMMNENIKKRENLKKIIDMNPTNLKDTEIQNAMAALAKIEDMIKKDQVVNDLKIKLETANNDKKQAAKEASCYDKQVNIQRRANFALSESKDPSLACNRKYVPPELRTHYAFDLAGQTFADKVKNNIKLVHSCLVNRVLIPILRVKEMPDGEINIKAKREKINSIVASNEKLLNAC